MTTWFFTLFGSAVTILGGAITFALGQSIQKFFLEPIHEQKKLQGEILSFLTSNYQAFSNPKMFKNEDLRNISNELRRLSAKIISQFQVIPFYEWIQKPFGLSSKDQIHLMYKNLIWLSNSILSEDSSSINNIEFSDTIINQMGLLTAEQLKANKELVEK